MSDPGRSLDNLQRDLAAALLDFDTDARARFAADIIPGGKLSAEGAIDVYGAGYPARLTEQLGETFEGVWAVLGDASFFRCCREFVLSTRSTSYNLSDYGAGFAEFLRTTPEIEALPFLSDLASFEWCFKNLFHSAEDAPADPTAISEAGDWTALSFSFGRAFYCFESDWAIYSVWQQRAGRADGTAPLDWHRSERGFVYKREGQTFAHTLGAPAFLLLKSLVAGATVSEAVTRAEAARGEIEESDVTSLFQTILTCGVVTGFGAD